MTNQEVFDKVARHLLTQKKRAMLPDSQKCVYRMIGDGGKVLKCAVGCLIPDELYKERGGAAAAGIGAVAGVLLVWFAVMLLVFFAGGCGGLPTDYASADGGAPVDLLQSEAGPPETAPPGGRLPLGYYQRQCQWDACGGPLPTNPVQLGEGGQ